MLDKSFLVLNNSFIFYWFERKDCLNKDSKNKAQASRCYRRHLWHPHELSITQYWDGFDRFVKTGLSRFLGACPKALKTKHSCLKPLQDETFLISKLISDNGAMSARMWGRRGLSWLTNHYLMTISWLSPLSLISHTAIIITTIITLSQPSSIFNSVYSPGRWDVMLNWLMDHTLSNLHNLVSL